MVECEYAPLIIIYKVPLVLIDTWWNVNLIDLKMVGGQAMVLIDTWWNVNENKIPSFVNFSMF